MTEKDKNLLQYVQIYSMLMELYENKIIDKDRAVAVNKKCADQLKCQILLIE